MAMFYKWCDKYWRMDVFMMSHQKELEDENCRLKKMYLEERLETETAAEALKKVVKPSSEREMAKKAVTKCGVSERAAC